MSITRITGDDIFDEQIDSSKIKDDDIRSEDIKDGEVKRSDINITTSGSAIITKIIAGTGISISETGVDAGTGDVTINATGSGGLDPTTHRALDQLVHDIAENSFVEIVRNNNKVDEIIVWETSSKLKKIREILITRTSNKVSQLVTKQYDASGILVETLTETINRSGNKVASIDRVLT